MKKWPTILFFCGLLIQLLALFGDHATEIPLFLRLVAPSYQHSKSGITKLVANRKLEKTDDGFREITSVLLADFRKRNNVSPTIKDIKIEKIWLEVQATRGDQPVEGYVLVDFEFSTTTTKVFGVGGNVGFMTAEKLKESVEDLKEPNILITCILLFLVGSAVEVIAFFAERSESRKEHKRESEKSSDLVANV